MRQGVHAHAETNQSTTRRTPRKTEQNDAQRTRQRYWPRLLITWSGAGVALYATSRASESSARARASGRVVGMRAEVERSSRLRILGECRVDEGRVLMGR